MSSLNNRNLKNHAVIQLISSDDNFNNIIKEKSNLSIKVYITLVYHLEKFSRSWIDCPQEWPQTVTWFKDDGDLQCKILKIDSKLLLRFFFLKNFSIKSSQKTM